MCTGSEEGSHRLSLRPCKIYPELQVCPGALAPNRQQRLGLGALRVQDLGHDPEVNGQPYKDHRVADWGSELGTGDRSSAELSSRSGRVRKGPTVGGANETSEVLSTPTPQLIRVTA